MLKDLSLVKHEGMVSKLEVNINPTLQCMPKINNISFSFCYLNDYLIN